MADDGYFDARVARTYDADHGAAAPEVLAACVDRLADLATGGPALEFAIGTGRVALPLHAKGVSVTGIELSQAMVDQMRAKPGGQEIHVTIGDMAQTRVPGEFSLVFLVFNTITNLTSQAEQVACFRNAAAHLAPGGRFVVEVGVPPLQCLPFGETKLAFNHSEDYWGMDEIDVADQAMVSHHVWFREDGTTDRLSVPFRYVWPAELDLMAQLAGMGLEERWADWVGTPFDRFSTAHVSVWRKPVA